MNEPDRSAFTIAYDSVADLSDRGQYREAISACRAILASGRFEHPWERYYLSLRLGFAQYQAGDFAPAVATLGAAIAFRSDEFYPNYYLGRSLLALERKREALPYLTQAAAACTGFPDNLVDVVQSALTLTLEIEGVAAAAALASRLDGILANSPDAEAAWLSALVKGGHFDEVRAALARSRLAPGCKPQLRFIRSVSAGLAEVGETTATLGPAERIRIVTPQTVRTTSSETVVFGNAPYIAELPEATIIGGSSIILLGEDRVLADFLAHPLYGRHVNLCCDRQVIGRHPEALLVAGGVAEQALPRGVMLSGLASDAYGHWIPEFVARIEVLARHPAFAETPIIVDEGMPATHYEMLGLLVENTLHRVSRGTRLRVGRLIVAPTPTFFPIEIVEGAPVPAAEICPLSPHSLRFLRNKVTERLGRAADQDGRFFLSRRNVRWRRLVNEDELIAQLAQFGFEVVHVEELGFREQVRLFQRARCVVAPNGSALLNLVFAAPSTQVVVLSQEELFNWGGFVGPMMELGFAPTFVIGRADGKTRGKHSDYWIDPQAVTAALKGMDRGGASW